MEIDILTGSILIGLFLTNVILILLDRHQRKVFRQTEKRLRDALLKKIEMQLRDTLLSTKAHLQDALLNTEKQLQDKLLKKIEEVEHLQHRHHQTEKQLQDKLLEKIEEVETLQTQRKPSTPAHTPSEPTYSRPPPKLFYTNSYWVALSAWYREEQGWRCEHCRIHLKSRKEFLHTHHIRGRAYNNPKDLRALCLRCHSNQTQPINHNSMKNTQEYRCFMKYREGKYIMIAEVLWTPNGGRLVVAMPDNGVLIRCENATDTFVEAIKRIDIEKVKDLDINVGDRPLISTTPVSKSSHTT